MNKIHYLRKHIVASFFAMMACVAFNLSAIGQVATIAGTAITNSYLYGPMYSFNAAPRTVRMATHYPAAQLAAAGIPAGAIITSVSYERGQGSNGQAMAATSVLKLYLENQPASSLDLGAGTLTWATVVTPATLVYDGNPASIVGTTAGWKNIPFGIGTGAASTFTYTGGALVIYSEWVQSTAPTVTIGWVYQSATSATPSPSGWTANSVKYSTSTTTTPAATMATGTENHANIQFDFYTGPCGTPNGGNATVTSPICSGDDINLSLSGHSSGLGQTIQWQYYNGTSWQPVAGATFRNATVNAVTATTQYRALVTCGANSATSNVVQANVVPTFVSSGTYTLNSALPTSGTNFQTIKDLDSAIKCGLTGALTINVNASGTYSGQLHLKNIGSSTNTITINGNGATITYSGADDLDRACIKLDNADYVTINDLNITTATGATYGWGIQLVNDADNCMINGCTINNDIAATSTNFVGISVSGSHNSATTAGSGADNLTINNTTVNGGYYGITILGASGTQMNNTQITNCSVKNTYAYAIYSSYTNNTIIRNNDISRENRASSTTFAGCYMTTGHTKLTIDKNKIHDWFTTLPASTSTAYGVYISASNGSVGNEHVISNNIFYNIKGNGSQYGIYNSASSYSRYYYNTFVFDYTASAATTQVCYGLYHTSATPNCEFRNNIVYITRGGAGNKAAVYMNTATTSVVTANYNDYYINSPTAGTNYIGAMGGTLQTTMAGWQTASGGDANSVLVDPAFVNPLLGNLIPTVATGLNNLGTPIAGITTDITGATRNATTPDMGAFEWTPPLCLQPTGLNATAVTATGATLGWAAVTGATGYEWFVSSSATPPATGTPIAGISTPSGTLTPSTYYYLHVRANCGANGYSYWNSIQFATRPVNDDCLNSINISNSLPTAGSTVGATQTMAPCATTTTTLLANDVWYHFTTTAVGDVAVTGTNTAGDIAMEVFSGTCGTFTSLGCVDGPAVGTELITLPALAPGTYYVRIYGYLSIENAFTVQVLINGFPLSTNEVNISAVNKGSYNLVNWNITSDAKYNSFDLERSGDGERFTQIATVAANEGNEYAYNDNKPLTGINYYRIKTVDRSGKASYSKVVFTSVKDADVFTAEAYPNPVQDKFTVKVYGNQGSNAQIVVTDIAGKLMRQVSVTGNETIIDMSGMDQGIYFVKYQDNVHSEVMKITKQ